MYVYTYIYIYIYMCIYVLYPLAVQHGLMEPPFTDYVHIKYPLYLQAIARMFICHVQRA